MDLKNAKCSSSSKMYSSRYTCVMAFDGNEATEFISRREGVGLWIEVTFPRMLTVAQVDLLNRKNTVMRRYFKNTFPRHSNSFINVGEMNKDVVIYFDNNEERSATMLLSTSQYVQKRIDPPVPSKTMRITVLSVYSRYNNGFSEIKVYEASSKVNQTEQFSQKGKLNREI